MRFPSASICALAALCASLNAVGTAAAGDDERRRVAQEGDGDDDGGRHPKRHVRRASNVFEEKVRRRLTKKRETESINGVPVTTDEDGAPALEGRYLFTGADADGGKGKSVCPQLKKIGVDQCKWYEHVGVGSFVVPENEGHGNSAKEKKFVRKALSPGGILSGLVENIDADTHVHALAEESAEGGLWGLDYTDGTFDRMHTFETGHDASNVYIAIMDTGVQCSHPEFQDGPLVSCTKKFVADGIKDSNGDENGHGTHCAGTAIGKTTGVAKGLSGANLWSYQVLNRNGSGSWSGLIDALDHLAGIAAANPGNRYIASLSLGGGATTTVDRAANRLASKGNAYVVVAAGNEADNACSYSPARAAYAITVGSITSSESRSSWSNYGSCVDLFAPGSGILSSWKNSGYNTISGTSMATPHVTGAVAVLIAAGMDVNSNLYKDDCTNNYLGDGSPNTCLTTAATLGTGPSSSSSSSSSTTTTTTTTASSSSTTTTTSGTDSTPSMTTTTTTTTQSGPSANCVDHGNSKELCAGDDHCTFSGKGRWGTCVDKSSCGTLAEGERCYGDNSKCVSCTCKNNGRCA